MRSALLLDAAQRAALREDLADVLISGLFLALGLAAIGVAAWRSRSTSRPLVYFGLLSALYGLRLMADTQILPTLAGISPQICNYIVAFVTYVIPVPATLFLLDLIGPGVASSIRWMLRFEIVYAAVTIAIDLARGPGASMGSNSAITLVALVIFAGNGLLVLGRQIRSEGWRSLGRDTVAFLVGSMILVAFSVNENLVNSGLVPWSWSYEALGMLAFVAALGYVVSHRFFDAESRLASISQEMETARRIQESILPRRMPEVAGLALAARYQPMASVGGDFYDFVPGGPGQVGALLADVSGHGVPAALIASMVKIALSAQAEHAADPAAVLAGMSRILHGKLERGFVTAAYVWIDATAGRVIYANAGHPPLLCGRPDGEIREVRREGLPLGRFRKAAYENLAWDLAPGDRLLLYTDGVIEARSPAGEELGEDRLRDFAASPAGAERLVDDLLAGVAAWCGRRPGEPLDDDVTVLALDIQGAP
jgi:sigma-B regulation protein RsbU (phosphoserine phosphatase)